MLDIKYIRQEPDDAKECLVARGGDAREINELLVLDEKRRALVTGVENLKAERNVASKQIGLLIG